LPLIYTLNNASNDLRRKMIYSIKNENRQPRRVQWIIEQVVAAGGIEYASAKMDEYRLGAAAILNSFGDSEVKNALLQLVEFTTKRKY
jgi:octaprenyl-diphosphate synthase